MARQMMTRLIDDLDQGVAVETVEFGLDSVDYEIDLSAKNAAKLRRTLEPYMAAGQRVGRRGRRPARRGRAAPSDPAQNKAIRAWARRKRKPISDRGRIPEEIVAEYHASAGR